MKLGIDLRPIQGETFYRGIGKSLFYFIQNLSTVDIKGIEFIFYVNKGEKIPDDLNLPSNSSFVELSPRKLGNVPKIKVFVPKNKSIRTSKNKVDIFLQYDFTLGIPKNIPTIAVFYDLIPFLFKNEERKLLDSKSIKDKLGYVIFWRRYLKNLGYFKKIDKIISISNASKKDLLKLFPEIQKNKVQTIYLGINKPNLKNEKISSIVSELLNDTYLLYVGGIDYRKNIVHILDSFIELKKDFPKLKLVTVGKEFNLTNNLEKIGWNERLNKNTSLKKDVIWAGYVNQTELRELYKNACVYVFPTKYEGFGLPILEAMEAGCPVVSYNNSSIPEVAGDAAILIDNGKPMAPYIKKIISDNAFRAEMIKKGLIQAKKFSWQKNCQETINLIKELAESKGIMQP